MRIKTAFVKQSYKLKQTENWYNVRVFEDLTRARNRLVYELKQLKLSFKTTDGRFEIVNNNRTTIDNLYDLQNSLELRKRDTMNKLTQN